MPVSYTALLVISHDKNFSHVISLMLVLQGNKQCQSNAKFLSAVSSYCRNAHGVGFCIPPHQSCLLMWKENITYHITDINVLILGWDSSVGAYTRVEGTPNDPNADKPFSKIEIKDLFNNEGKLNPSITVIG